MLLLSIQENLRRGLTRKCMFLVQIQPAITGFLTFYWSRRTASPLLTQWTVRINWFWQLESVDRIHIHLEATWSHLLLTTLMTYFLDPFILKDIKLLGKKTNKKYPKNKMENYFLRSEYESLLKLNNDLDLEIEIYRSIIDAELDRMAK